MKRWRDIAGTWLMTELLRGLLLTGRNLFQRKITVQYPEEKTPQSPRFRGLQSILTKEMLLAIGARYEAEIEADRLADAPYR